MIFYQTQFGVPQNPYLNINPDSSFLNSPYFFIALDFLALIILLIILVFLIRLFLHYQRLTLEAFQKAVLLITVPKESSSEAKEQKSIEEIKNQIAVAESWLSTLGGLKAQRGFKNWLFGRSDHFSLEITVQNGLISFYIVVPNYLKEYMEQQILAQYPEANITQTGDYNIFSTTGTVIASYLRLTRSYIFPINTYQRLQSDPLNAVANSLSKIDKNDGAAIQIVARSAKKQWHYKGSKVARLLQQGKTLNQALTEAGGFSLFKIVNFISPGPKKKEENLVKEVPRTPTPLEQELIKGLEQKTSKAGFDCNIRIIVSAANKARAQDYLNNIINSFSQFNFYQYGNSFKIIKEKAKKLATDFIYRNYREGQKAILNTEELASLYHFPTPYLDTPNIRWLLAKRLPPPTGLPEEGLLLGESIYRGVKTNIYLKTSDRRRHAYIIGMTGTGKSVLLSNLAIQDIRNGKGVCVIDPHGSLVESILPNIPKERIDEVIYFNPADVERPTGLNMLEAQTIEQQDFVIQEMISIFYKLVTDPTMIGPVFEHNMRNAMLTLMADKEAPGTIVEIPRIFTDKEFQAYKIAKVTDPMVRSFWEQEMAKTSDFHKSEMLGYLISKVSRFVENSMMRNIIGQPKSGFDFRDIMNQGKILLVNLNKGKIGEINSNLLGLILVAKLQMAALSRTDLPEEERKDFYLYIDEFQNFITDSISTILAEARKYRLNLILAHQYIGQLTEGVGVEGKSYGEKIKDAIFGNVGTMIAYRIGVEDAEIMAKQLAPTVNEYDLINIDRFNAYARLLVDNEPRKAFNIHTFPPVRGNPEIVDDIKEFSRWKYGVDRNKIEKEILRRSQLGIKSEINPPVEKLL